jgi:putative ABC transport system ATP-binding protein
MSGLDRPEKGAVLINGRDILQLSQKQIDEFRSREMGFIFQSFFIEGNETCADNVSLPLEINELRRSERDVKVSKALHAVGLSDKKNLLAKNLSGGQKQRLAVARAIVAEPRILFADEPTGNLDSTTGAQIEKLLFDHNKESGAILIIVTHDLELAKKCQIQILIKDGQIAEVHGGAK